MTIFNINLTKNHNIFDQNNKKKKKTFCFSEKEKKNRDLRIKIILFKNCV